MGTIYLKGDCDIDKNIDKAIEWYQISLNYHPTHALDAIYQAYVEKAMSSKPITMHYNLIKTKFY
ncbi:hypothetical protein J4731_15325 [Providencia rettgeri]|nr:hypothetical protein [Providencia rettgeri]